MLRRAIEGMVIALPDDQSLDVALRPGPDEPDVEITVLEPLSPRAFHCCPICGDPATTDEHVPPRRLGGKKMTRTCEPCNGRLGSLVEPDLIDWLEDAITLPRLRSTGVPGSRGLGRILFRTTPDGTPVLIVDGSSHPDTEAMLLSGEVDLEAGRPDRNRYSIALLKHAYLSACLKYGVPEGEAADMVRRDLIAARNAKDRQRVPRSELALGLTVARGYGQVPFSDPVVRALLHDDDGDREGVLLGGQIFVSWSSRPDVSPARATPLLRTRLQIGAPLPGTIVSIDPEPR